MTPYDKIRAALELADNFDDAYSTSSERDAKNEAMTEALAALAELERVAAPVPTQEAIAGAVADILGDAYHCTRAWSAWSYGTMTEDDFYSVSESDTPNEIAAKVAGLYAAPPAPVAEIREPTPEECERIYAFWLNSEGCNGRTLGERMGGLTFNAVRAVMWPKSEGL